MPLAAARSAGRLVVQVNEQSPRTFVNSAVHVSEAAAIVESPQPLPQLPSLEVTPVHLAIGRHVANLVPHGATIQIGIGGIPKPCRWP